MSTGRPIALALTAILGSPNDAVAGAIRIHICVEWLSPQDDAWFGRVALSLSRRAPPGKQCEAGRWFREGWRRSLPPTSPAIRGSLKRGTQGRLRVSI